MSASEKEKRPQGRPRTAEDRKVYESLILAAEQCIGKRGTADLSATEIAEVAGSSYKMIAYYFGSTGNLMFLIMKRAVREMYLKLKELEPTLLAQGAPNPIWRIVNACAAYTRTHSACARVIPVRGSQVPREFYLELQPTVHVQLSKMLRQLIDAGIYSPQLDIRYATATLGILLAAQTLYAGALPMHELTTDDLHSDSWLIYVSSMLDQQFRNPQRLTPQLQLAPPGVDANNGARSTDYRPPGRPNSRIHRLIPRTAR